MTIKQTIMALLVHDLSTVVSIAQDCFRISAANAPNSIILCRHEGQKILCYFLEQCLIVIVIHASNGKDVWHERCVVWHENLVW